MNGPILERDIAGETALAAGWGVMSGVDGKFFR